MFDFLCVSMLFLKVACPILFSDSVLTVGEKTHILPIYSFFSHQLQGVYTEPKFLTIKEPKNRFQGINLPSANVAWRAGTTSLFLLGS
jgi:hypothetical protein